MRSVPERSAVLTLATLLVAFVVVSVLFATLAGACVGVFSSASFLLAVPAYAVAGAGYGAALWLLAHYGYLPFPEPE